MISSLLLLLLIFLIPSIYDHFIWRIQLFIFLDLISSFKHAYILFWNIIPAIRVMTIPTLTMISFYVCLQFNLTFAPLSFKLSDSSLNTFQHFISKSLFFINPETFNEICLIYSLFQTFIFILQKDCFLYMKFIFHLYDQHPFYDLLGLFSLRLHLVFNFLIVTLLIGISSFSKRFLFLQATIIVSLITMSCSYLNYHSSNEVIFSYCHS